MIACSGPIALFLGLVLLAALFGLSSGIGSPDSFFSGLKAGGLGRRSLNLAGLGDRNERRFGEGEGEGGVWFPDEVLESVVGDPGTREAERGRSSTEGRRVAGERGRSGRRGGAVREAKGAEVAPEYVAARGMALMRRETAFARRVVSIVAMAGRWRGSRARRVASSSTAIGCGAGFGRRRVVEGKTAEMGMREGRREGKMGTGPWTARRETISLESRKRERNERGTHSVQKS